MRIRTQILLGYSYLVALLLAGALGAAVSFYQLGHELDRMLGSAASDSRLRLESTFHENVGDLLKSASAEARGPAVDGCFTAFRAALDEAAAKSTDPDKTAILEQMDLDLKQLCTFLESVPTSEENTGPISPEFFGLVEILEKDLGKLATREEKILLRADEQLRRRTSIRTMAFSLLVIVALLSLVLLSRELRKSLLSRLDELRDLAHEIRRGHSQRRAFVESRDELGLLAEAINALLDAWDEERQESKGRELRRRRIIIGLLHALGKPAVLRLPDGRILASTDDRLEKEAEAFDPEEAREQGWEIRPLTTPSGAQAGTLLIRNADDDTPSPGDETAD